jgi:hypothetical protein
MAWVGLRSWHQRASVQSSCGSAVVACDGRGVSIEQCSIWRTHVCRQAHCIAHLCSPASRNKEGVALRLLTA